MIIGQLACMMRNGCVASNSISHLSSPEWPVSSSIRIGLAVKACAWQTLQSWLQFKPAAAQRISSSHVPCLGGPICSQFVNYQQQGPCTVLLAQLVPCPCPQFASQHPYLNIRLHVSILAPCTFTPPDRSSNCLKHHCIIIAFH